MFKNLFGSKNVRSKNQKNKGVNTTVDSDSQYLIVKTPDELLATDERLILIKKIKRLLSVTEEVWQSHYLESVKRFAGLVQQFPASEIHHHSQCGGLLDHTLEALHSAIKISQGTILPPYAQAEDIRVGEERWRYGIFLTVLAHDIGKIVTDLEIVYRNRSTEKFTHWHPWFEPMNLGAEYTFRYKLGEKGKNIKLLHEHASISLLPKLLTREATTWLFSDNELLNQIFCTLNNSTFGGKTIAEIVRKADQSSVSRNLGADTGKDVNYSNKVPLHEKIITTLRYLIQEGSLKLNKPGAAIWVTESETWAVSKTVMQAVQLQLENEGHKGIPKNVVRLFSILNEHNLIIKNQNDDSVWKAEVQDFEKEWKTELTFLRFNNDVIWAGKAPPIFDGSITPICKNVGADLDESDFSKKQGIKTKDRESNKIKNTETISVTRIVELDNDNLPPLMSYEQDVDQILVTETDIKSGKSEPAPVQVESFKIKGSPKIKEEEIRKHDFFDWLLTGIASHNIRVNEPKADVHVLDKHIALVSPSILKNILLEIRLRKLLMSRTVIPLRSNCYKRSCWIKY